MVNSPRFNRSVSKKSALEQASVRTLQRGSQRPWLFPVSALGAPAMGAPDHRVPSDGSSVSYQGLKLANHSTKGSIFETRTLTRAPGRRRLARPNKVRQRPGVRGRVLVVVGGGGKPRTWGERGTVDACNPKEAWGKAMYGVRDRSS